MKEQIVTFETAVLAKSKGFDWPCMAGYDDSEKVWYPAGDKCASREPRQYKTHRHCTLAPTQSLLKKWLRGLQAGNKMFVESQPVDDWEHWMFMVYAEDIMSPFFEIPDLEMKEYITYELALEAGLVVALNNLPTIKI